MATRKNKTATPAGATLGAESPNVTVQEAVQSVKHRASRRNIPPAGLEGQGRVEEAPRVRYHHNPHLPPVLRSADDPAPADQLPELLQTARERPLSDDEARVLAAALRRHEPWLEWSGKRERPWFEVEPVALHIHERVSTQAMLRVLAREDVHRDLFADPQQTYAQAVQFYRHNVDWSNRMILGDSLAVMASLSRREDLAGKVQMIYIDPPYGISFKSNFQPQLGQRDVKDKVQDLTREPEMVKAYRDTWTLGIHSYLAYLRDRLAMARELLTESGSVFVQISDENLHRVRCVMDEVFGSENQIVTIVVQKKGSQKGEYVQPINDYVLWYAKEKFSRDGALRARFRPIYVDKQLEDDTSYDRAELPTGEEVEPSPAAAIAGAALFVANPLTSGGDRRNQSLPFEFCGRPFTPGTGNCWKTTVVEDDGSTPGMERLAKAERLWIGKNQLRIKAYQSDFGVKRLTNFWVGLGGAKNPIYVVQTNPTVIERCILMTTDPGDLVLDPTCGSGTTAFVAEKWGRRWITCDTSRVALALAKQRLMTATFDHHRLRPLTAEDRARNPRGAWLRNGTPEPMTFQCRTVPHVTLKSIARNTALDPIFARHQPLLDAALVTLNGALAGVKPALKQALAAKLVRKHREDGPGAVSDADQRRWLLPGTHAAAIQEAKAARPLKALTPKQALSYRAAIPAGQWQPWQVPFDTDPDWPAPLREALLAYRAAWRAKMDEVNACIAAHAGEEELVDQPEPVPGVVRVAGPFTMEGVIGLEQGLDREADESPIGGEPDALDNFDDLAAGTAGAGGGAVASVNAEAHLDKLLRLLKAAGVDFAGNVVRHFDRLEPCASPGLLHAEGAWLSEPDKRVAISLGPEVGNITVWQVEEATRSANRAGFDELVFAGFGFDAAAQAVIDEGSMTRLRLHMALIRPDVAMGELLKTQPGSQIFMVFSAPRVSPPKRLSDGQFTLEMQGMDVYDPVSNALHPTSRDRVAAWFVDTDYDGRSFCICQAFFPDRSKWDKLARALGERGVVDEGRFDALTGFESLPFARPAGLAAGRPWRVAVKVIDPRGNEGLRVLTMPD